MNNNYLNHLLSNLIVNIVTLNYLVIKKIIKENMKPYPQSVLDLGCGTGILASLFPKKGYIGIDLDPTIVEYAGKKHTGYLFKAGNATNFRLNKKFDYIQIIGVLHHMDNKDINHTLKNLKTHLKKNGKILIIEAIPPIFKWNILGKFLRKHDKGAYIRELNDYSKAISKYFKIEGEFTQLGGLADYGVFYLEHKTKD